MFLDSLRRGVLNRNRVNYINVRQFHLTYGPVLVIQDHRNSYVNFA